MQYRPFRPSDHRLLADFSCATSTDPRWARRIDKMIRQDLLPTIEDPGRDIRVWVAEAPDGALAGVAVLEKSGPEQWELSVLGVSANHRRQGVGRDLIAHAVTGTEAGRTETVAVLVDYRNLPMVRLIRSIQGVRNRADQLDGGWTAYAIDPAVLVRQLQQEPKMTRSAPAPQQPKFGF